MIFSPSSNALTSASTLIFSRISRSTFAASSRFSANELCSLIASPRLDREGRNRYRQRRRPPSPLLALTTNCRRCPGRFPHPQATPSFPNVNRRHSPNHLRPSLLSLRVSHHSPASTYTSPIAARVFARNGLSCLAPGFLPFRGHSYVGQDPTFPCFSLSRSTESPPKH